MYRLLLILLLLILSAACDEIVLENGNSTGGETGRVVDVIDGDTIDVDINGIVQRIRYVGVNTPERNETCYSSAVQANAGMVEGAIVRLVKDTSETDRYDRLLRYVYVGNLFVNRELVVQGYAEAVLYQPDDQYWSEFVDLERQSARSSRGCHPTGIFDDGSDTR